MGLLCQHATGVINVPYRHCHCNSPTTSPRWATGPELSPRSCRGRIHIKLPINRSENCSEIWVPRQPADCLSSLPLSLAAITLLHCFISPLFLMLKLLNTTISCQSLHKVFFSLFLLPSPVPHGEDTGVLKKKRKMGDCVFFVCVMENVRWRKSRWLRSEEVSVGMPAEPFQSLNFLLILVLLLWVSALPPNLFTLVSPAHERCWRCSFSLPPSSLSSSFSHSS